MSVAAAFLLCGYEFIRSASNTLFKDRYGPANLPLVMAATPAGVLFVLWVYGRILSWRGPRATLWWTSLGSAGLIFACWALIRGGIDLGTALLYVVREAYIVLLLEQYWSFLNSTLGPIEARRHYGPVTGIASLGAIGGGLLVHRLAEPLGTEAMPLFAAAALLPAALCSGWAYRGAGEPRPTADEAGGRRGHLGVRRLLDSPLLVLVLLLVLVTQVVSTMLDLRFQGILQDAMPDADRQTAWSGRFYALLNGVAALLQFGGTPLALRFLPLALVHLAIPLIHLGACAALLLRPSLASAGTAYLLFKVLDYSVFRAAKEILYIPLSFDARYRAKELIDVFGYRFAKGGVSLGVTVLQRAGLIAASAYSALALLAALVWLVLAARLARMGGMAPDAVEPAAGPR